MTAVPPGYYAEFFIRKKTALWKAKERHGDMIVPWGRDEKETDCQLCKALIWRDGPSPGEDGGLYLLKRRTAGLDLLQAT
jgi:hypothetical protein